MPRTQLRVTGTVQGVGFRPFVHRHAVRLGLVGFVRNDAAGVLIEVEGEADRIAQLASLLVDEAPPLARVAHVATVAVAPDPDDSEFRIIESFDGGTPSVPVSVDTATCEECLAEVDDPANRRSRYPFTNCTNCGPRYTIVESVPYDRPATTMAGFTMCPACQAEYDDPADRRFHAQPNACGACGPRLVWRSPAGEILASRDRALRVAAAALRDGRILAVKGLGGYHLVVDATDASAVGALRRRKARDDKPFAVMVADLDAARDLVVLDEVSSAALSSIRRPIVLAPRQHGSTIVDTVAPGLPDLGVMLPYTALHHLLLADAGRPLVMTSGNLSDEPIAHEDDDAIARLGPLVDGLLTHDRPIHIRCDDSVARAASGRIQMLRRSRGHAPEPLPLSAPARRAVLAVGAELKNTIAVAKNGMVVASHHIGDLEHLATYRSFLRALDHLRRLYGVTPDVVAHDLHPEYLSTKLAMELDLPTCGVQHHHAHVASCMVEHGRTDRVLGVAFDGMGYGTDGTMWGGEFLVADLDAFIRVGHLCPIAMPGGVAAIREPWRMGLAWATHAGEGDRALASFSDVDDTSRDAVRHLVERAAGPVTTSVGRLFDAVASLLDGRRRVNYEGQAAMELEGLARTVARPDAPSFGGLFDLGDVGGLAVLDPAPLLRAIVEDRDRCVPIPVLAAGFHEALGRATASLAAGLARAHGLDTVALTGGVFQNTRFTEIVESALHDDGLHVLVHRQVPPNDGGISIGQAAIAARGGAGVVAGPERFRG